MATYDISTDPFTVERIGFYDPSTGLLDDAGPAVHRWVAFQEIEPNAVAELSTVIEVQAEQSADFVATAGQDGVCHEWPVDMRAYAAGGILNVTPPASPAVGDCFAVFDSRLACDNGIDFPGLNRNIYVNFTTAPVHSLPAPDFAAINTAGGRIEFVYTDANIGWRIASNVNR